MQSAVQEIVIMLFVSSRTIALKPYLACAALVSSLSASAAHAETIQVVQGAAPVPLGKSRVLCGEPAEGWTLSGDRLQIAPPTKLSAANRSFQGELASDPADCGRANTTVSLRATGPWPEIDGSSVILFPDEGRVDFKGTGLEGVQVAWQWDNPDAAETCLAPTAVGKNQQCSLPLQRSLSPRAVLHWLPAYAELGPDVVTYDVRGHVVDHSVFVLRPARIVLGRVFAPAEAIDISQGVGTVPLAHPEAVASADCGLARCELSDDGLALRYVPAYASQVSVSVRLSPRFYLGHGDKLDTSATASFPVLRCPLSVVSGPPMRDADAPHILIRMADRCQSGARLRWTVGGEPGEVVREVRSGDGYFVLLRSGQLAGGSVTISAIRADTLAGVVGSVTTPTMAPPRPESTLELAKYGPINFIPTNRDALWSVASVTHARLLPLDLPGAYSVRTEKGRTFIRGMRNVGGFASLRYAYRRDDLPKGFEDVDLAILSEATTRPLREASVPVALATVDGKHPPLAELICADRDGKATPLAPGKPGRIPFSARETCRVVIYQQRLSPEDGLQEVVLEVEVTKASGGRRGGASLNERMVLRPGGEPRVFFLRGITAQFDEVTVRLSHVVDETRYVLGPTAKQAPPSAQWSAIVEGGRARLHVSLSIPAGLYRINEPAASMTLNFGVLARITWLTRQGKEGLLGLETGVLGASLIPQEYNNNPAFPPTLVTLLGAGLRVEVGQGAAVGVHLWGAYEFRSEYSFTPEGDTSPRKASHWSLLFGPSISIGNFGTNL
jgi:hypothetical protein